MVLHSAVDIESKKKIAILEILILLSPSRRLKANVMDNEITVNILFHTASTNFAFVDNWLSSSRFADTSCQNIIRESASYRPTNYTCKHI